MVVIRVNIAFATAGKARDRLVQFPKAFTGGPAAIVQVSAKRAPGTAIKLRKRCVERRERRIIVRWPGLELGLPGEPLTIGNPRFRSSVIGLSGERVIEHTARKSFYWLREFIEVTWK